jgi:2-methylcitrate dehydratase PrpD
MAVVSKPKDAVSDLARFVVQTAFDDLTPDAIEVTKRDVLDTLGVIVAGSSFAASPEIVALSREWGGAPQSTILAYGDKVPAPVAAFVNGTMGHALDFDDNHDKAICHVGPATICASLALGEKLGRLDGKGLITAVVLGADVIIRLGRATTRPLHESGFMFSPLYGYFGSAAAASKVLAIDEGAVVNAFGITYSQAAGNLQVNIDDEHALTKRLQIGFATKAGVVSALLAQKGLTGAQNSLEGRFGLFNLYQRGAYDRSALLDGLGERFEIENLSFKPYACCRQVHAHVDAALQVRREHSIEPEEIEEIKVFVNADPHFLCDPPDIRRRPHEEVHAQFSLPYSVGAAFAYGEVLIKDYTLPALSDPAVLAIADRITPTYDPDLPTRIIPPARMEVITKDGRILASESIVEARGHPTNPMTFDELADKFRDCVSHSAEPLDDGDVERAIELCADLEQVGDVREIVDLLTPRR